METVWSSMLMDINPDIYVLHVGTNDITLSDKPEQIAEHIFDIVNSLKTCSNADIVSRDNKNKEKMDKAIQIINVYDQRNISVIKHTSLNSKRHLNRNRLHLNGYRKSIFIRNFKKT